MTLSFPARELVKGLWCEADDNGIFVWKPLTIKARIFPADNLDVNELLAELTAADFISAFDDSGKRYGAVRNFLKYQRPRRPSVVHPLPQNADQYLGGPPLGDTPPAIDRINTEQDGHSSPLSEPLPTMSGMSPQMEDGGGSKEGSVGSSEPTGAKSPSMMVVAGTEHHPPPDPKKQLYEIGKGVLGKHAGGQITKLIAHHGGDLAAARYTLDRVSEAAFPAEYLGKILSGDKPAPHDYDAEMLAMGMRPDGTPIGMDSFVPPHLRPGDDGSGPPLWSQLH